MYKEVFLISVAVAMIFLIIHSYSKHGIKYTLSFFIGGFLFGFVRELIYAKFVHTYSSTELSLTLFGVSLALPIGWVFTFYLANEFSSKIISVKSEKNIYKIIFLSSIFADTICLAIETASVNMGWWTLGPAFLINDDFAPIGLLTGWWYTTVIFLYLWYIANKKIPSKYLIYTIFIGLIAFGFESIIVLPSLSIIWAIIIIISCIICVYIQKQTTFLGIGILIFVILQNMFFPFVPSGILIIFIFLYEFIFAYFYIIRSKKPRI